ncbi:NAD-dependent epimerase [Saccharopolyspora taberi]|uniref:NAD(P)H-binding protein n=1 Tax=Saccharopolyspora taberi TaxID=60895 RepID=A0ABN3V926_9PSEU
MRLVLFGATGFAGGRILREATARGHEVVPVARGIGSEGRAGSLHDEPFALDVTAGADVVVVAIPARPLDDGTRLIDALPTLYSLARKQNARLGFVGGAGSLRVSDGGPRVIDTPEFPEAYKPEAGSHAEVLDALREAPEDVDWFYVSPAAVFGAHSPGERTGAYRTGGDVLVTDENGNSAIGGDDYAIAFLDEIERPAHRRTRFTVAY